MRIALTTVVCFAAIAIAAPVPTHLMRDGEGLYWSAVEGVTLVYDRNSREETRIVSKVERVKDGRLVTTDILKPDGRREMFHKVLISSKGVFITERLGYQDFPSPMEMIRLPFKPGAKWEEMPGSKAYGTRKAVREEKVTVPAGEFNCLSIEAQNGDGSLSTHWYAAGIGVVKVDYGDSKMELKSVTYPKPKK